MRDKSKGNSVTEASEDVNEREEDSLVEHPPKHPPKRIRLYSEEDVILDNEEYEEAVQGLHDEYFNRKKHKKGNHQVVKELMEKTKKKRHEWIREDRPLITEILDKFPVLRTSRWVG